MKKYFFNAPICLIACITLVACEKQNSDTIFMQNLKISKISNYLYEVYYDDYDYNIAEQHSSELYKVKPGACSSVRNNNFIGRNYDWYYDEQATFIIHTPAKNGRHATIGVASGLSKLTPDFIESGAYSSDYKILPFMTVDGINDMGVAININVVPTGDLGFTTGTNPNGRDMYMLTAIRYVLDYADSVDTAIDLLRASNLYSANTENLAFEAHFMISDNTKTSVVEFINNEMVVVDNVNIMTNFYLASELTPHAMGMERYKILQDNYLMGETHDGMVELMKKVIYSQTYKMETTPFWYSEFSADYGENSFGNLTKDTPHQKYNDIITKSIEVFNNRQRDGKTWHTVHTSVYDLKNKTLTIIPQESGQEFRFSL